MQDTALYFQLGLEHILDWQGYDHILFVTVLCGIFVLQDWRKVLVLVTAFTIGHSITLALSVLDKIKVPGSIIEFLIPVTILLTALTNIFSKKQSSGSRRVSFLSALFFGLIHGLGFSNYLKSLLGRQESIVGELLAFNLGLEAGQLVIVLAILVIAFVVLDIFRAPRREWNLFLSSAIFGIAFMMALERLGALL